MNDFPMQDLIQDDFRNLCPFEKSLPSTFSLCYLEIMGASSIQSYPGWSTGQKKKT